VRFSGAASVGLVTILLLSVLGKLIAARPDPSPDAAPVATVLAGVFSDSGLEARVIETRHAPGVYVEARVGECHILAGDYPSNDTYADVYQALAGPFGSLHYAYRGVLQARPPKLRALFDFYLWREIRRVGLPRRRAPVIAVAATPDCDLTKIDWRRVAAVRQ